MPYTNEIESESYKGYTIHILSDEDPISPREYHSPEDGDSTMVCWHGRYNLGDEQPKHSVSQYLADLVRELYVDDNKPLNLYKEAGETYAELREVSDEGMEYRWDKDRGEKLLIALQKKVILLPLYLYDHSGIRMNTGGFSCPWDSGQVGFIYIRNKDALTRFGKKVMTAKLRLQVINALESEVENYDTYISGGVLRFDITDKDDESIDACSGYYSKEDIYIEAKSVIDHAEKKMLPLFAYAGLLSEPTIDIIA